MAYNFKQIEKKWQKKWEDKKIFHVKENSKKKKHYVLEMFPYPSASGLHMGHALNYTIGDVFARFKRLQGFNVLHPMGFDALGLPAENAAIKAGQHPKPFTKKASKNYVRQMKEIGLSYDWDRLVSTMDPEYYKWDQWIFLEMLKKGVAYRKKAPVNWCGKCESVLANEQVHNGKCWRHEDTDVEIKHLDQWFFKVTDYADELLDGLDNLDWPQTIKTLQKNWIGKSYGTEILFEIVSEKSQDSSSKRERNGEKWPIFTTRPDTIYGVTFMVVSAQHPKLDELVTDKQKKEVDKFLKRLKSVSEKELEDMEKEGVFTGSYAINPINNEKIPVYAGNFVLADYGSGMVMAVPAHDQRDYEFAKKYQIPIKVVISSQEQENDVKIASAYTGDGILINSDKFDGINNNEAKEKITKYLKSKKLGKKDIQFKLRDWLISRQRYWGTPIPIIYCDKCGVVPVPEKDLPIELPDKVKFGKGNPLMTNEKWIKTKCPKCNADARRETDTMDTFVNSSWYFLRYADSKNKEIIFDKKKVKYWCPVDTYIGGREHACMHLIYSRFYTKFLRDLGLFNFDEPAVRLFNQGMLHGEDGDKMSKSKGNVILPEEVSKKYGMDTARLFLLSVASPDKNIDWSEEGIRGSLKFIMKIIDYFDNLKIVKKVDAKVESKLNKIIKEMTNQIENFKYNLAIIKVRDLFNSLPNEVSKEILEKSLKLLHPFCPHITEELWEKLGNKNFISLSEWPKIEESKIDDKFDKQEQAQDKLVSDIVNIIRIVEEKSEKKENVYVYVIPNELDFYDADEISKRVAKPVKVFATNDKNKHDPENKSKKVKPNRPGIYLE